MPSVSFPQPRDLGPREWGTETLMALTEHYSVKLLRMKAGTKGGLQYHRKKHEVAYLIEGNLSLTYGVDDGRVTVMLNPGACIEIPPGAVHQEEAITDCVILECSTPHFNDRVRVETQYGLPTEGGLPTTQEEDIRDTP